MGIRPPLEKLARLAQLRRRPRTRGLELGVDGTQTNVAPHLQLTIARPGRDGCSRQTCEGDAGERGTGQHAQVPCKREATVPYAIRRVSRRPPAYAGGRRGRRRRKTPAS